LAGLLASSSSARLFDECLKIFLAGSAEKSFLLLERFGLLDILFPDTAIALQTNRTGTLRDMLLESLRQTDARVNADKSVAPGFLFACLLWPAYCRELAILQNSGAELSVAQQRAADRVTLRQLERVAIPRRFSLPMHEIWQLQTRFNQRTRKRVFRLLAHPRFRAAFDFLALRATGIPELAEELHFWEQAQNMAPEQLAQSIPGQSKPSNGESAHVPPKRRRRRSKPKSTDG
jgi:poly(A) polymerase